MSRQTDGGEPCVRGRSPIRWGFDGSVTSTNEAPSRRVVGYTLGGGLGWYGRAHGLASSAVTAADVVLADGTRVRADADHEPDLLWR
jgi:hypothetical protein